MSAPTATRILDAASALMRVRGYHGVSFQDVAAIVGIRKASLYHHFPTKSALGRALVARACARVEGSVLSALRERDAERALARFLDAFTGEDVTQEEGVLLVVIGAEYPGLPEDVQGALSGFFADLEIRLADLLARGRGEGAFRFAPHPRGMAKLIVAALTGGMLTARSQGDEAHMGDLLAEVNALVGA